MIGGLVIETIVLANRVWINYAERQSRSQCAIYVERTPASEKVRLGDMLWWQGAYAMWTPLDKRFIEKKLLRIGSSGVNRPKERRVAAQEGAPL